MTESIAILRKRRGFRRGQLTKLKKQMDEIAQDDVGEQDINSLTFLKHAITEESLHHQDLQAKLEELLALEEQDEQEDLEGEQPQQQQPAEESPFSLELEQGGEYRKLYQGYKSAIENMVLDHNLYQDSEDLEQSYEEWASTVDPSSQTFLEESKELIERFENFISDSSKRNNIETIKNCRIRVQALRGKTRRLVHGLKAQEPRIIVPPPAESSTHRTRFDIDLPTFHGNPREWTHFYELFHTTMEKRGSHLTQEERCCILLKSLKSQEAKELAQLRINGKDGYSTALNALKQRYGHAQVILPLHVSTIQTSQQYDFDRDSLLLLGKTFITTFDALEAMDIDLSIFLTAYAASRFKPKLAEEWSKHTASLSGLPSMQDLAAYIESMICRLPTSSSTNNLIVKTSNLSIKTERAKPSPNKQCIVCNNGIHSLSQCSIFKGYTPEKRGKVVRDKKWCVNCLHPSHTSQNCPSAFTCKTCNLRHHTLLHRGETASSEQNSSQSTTNASSFLATSQSAKQAPAKGNNLESPVLSFLSTALVTAINKGRQRTARLALDSGSSTSLITESLASQLKLKRFPHKLNISGAYGDGSSRSYTEVTLISRHDPAEKLTVKLAVVSKLPTATPPNNTTHITSDDDVKGLQLADQQFGGRLDILLGTCDAHTCTKGHFKHIPSRGLTITPTLFGWTVSGPLQPGQTSKFLSIQTSPDDLPLSLQRLWDLDKVPESTQHSSNEESALQQFQTQHSVDPSGRYIVSLPRIDSPPQLGKSRNTAVRRFHSNERSLTKKDKLTKFDQSLREYEQLDHAELVPPNELNNNVTYYLPVHGVFKESSTTTKVRPVFDASAKTSNGVALNDLLLAGPNLYPLLTDLLIQFREHRIAFSADISKMFREIMLNIDEKDLHRFLMRDEQGTLRDYRMKRLTFGVKSSPFLATKVLHHLAETYAVSHPTASRAILRNFYVDDFLSGADSIIEASHIREELCQLLKLAGMTLRKWRTSSHEFASTIPKDLLETKQLTLTDAPKALGIHWDTERDILQVSTPDPPTSQPVTKRSIASNAAKVYDLLGFFGPFVIRSKMLLQETWKSSCGWDDKVSNEIQLRWTEWISELPTIHQHSISRRYHHNKSPVCQRTLHGFSDASNLAYGAVVYLRQLHADGTISISLVLSKARVAPLKAITIPRAELVAAHLLARLLAYTSKLLHIATSDIHAWTDSMIVLCWIRKSPSSLQTFVANRISHIQQLLPDIAWRHVSTKENPADLLSRGVTASALLNSSLWWVGPQWLSQTPIQCQQPTSALLKTVPETRAVTLTVIAQEQKLDLWKRYSSFNKLTRTVAWIRRFRNNVRQPPTQRSLHHQLQSKEIHATRCLLLRLSQQQTYPSLTSTIGKGKQPPTHHPLSQFNIGVNTDGLLTVSGRVRQSGSKEPKTVIPLSLKSSLVQLLVSTEHRNHKHPGISSLMAILTDSYYITGLKSQLKKISRTCPICQRAYAQTVQPPMGLLPSSRTTPTPPFQTTGLDFAGPLTIKKGHTRKPVLIKTYLCVFVCFATKAIHLELCSDLSTTAFMAALQRFCSRRGTPMDVYSDNGTNFMGAAAELRQIQHIVNSSRDAISHLTTATNLRWHFIPPRAPNFGGLWEAGVKQAKILLRKLIAPHPLTYEELHTIITEVEAILNSRPIAPLDSTEVDDELVLTPGHFLIGRPLKAHARQKASEANISSLRRWTLVQRLQQDLWLSWQAWYISTLGRRTKWHASSTELKTGDVVLVKDETLSTPLNWPLARITQLYPGTDGISRTVELLCNGKTYKRASNRIIPIHRPEST